MTAVSGTRILVGAVVAVVAVAVGAGIFLIGSPSEERTRRLDERRVDDLQRVASAARLYYTRHGRLPTSLTELAAEPGVALQPDDPVSAEPYAYRVVDPDTFELCALFERESTGGRTATFWSHGAGRQCFALQAEEPR